MKITLCGSIAFINQMAELQKQLETLGYEVKMPPIKFTDALGKVWDANDYYAYKKTQPFNDPQFVESHHQRIRDHFDKVEWSDAILVANYDKNGVIGYIGPNTLMEMGLAFFLRKKIFLLNSIPQNAFMEEVIGLGAIETKGNLELIK